MKDYIVRATAADEYIRAFAITSTGIVEKARSRHNTSPVATDALGRLLSAGAMMGVMMKGDKDVLTIIMRGDGPIGSLTVTADSHGNVKGYAANPTVIIPPNYAGKLDVGAAIGYGELTVIKDLGLKEPYSGTVPLGTSEVAEDLTYYFAKSEQTPTSVALGVLLTKENTVAQAGGFIIQLMPNTPDEIIDKLEEKLTKIKPITVMMEGGMTPEDILEEVIGEFGLVINEKIPAQFECNCSKEHVARALISIGKTELQSIIDDGKPINVRCHFCNTDYTYTVDEIKELLDFAKIKSAAGKLGMIKKAEEKSANAENAKEDPGETTDENKK